MPEGHSVVRWARDLRPLVGKPLLEVALPRRLRGREPELVGRRVTRIRTHGKHLLLHLSGGAVLHCHAMMWGDWWTGSPGGWTDDRRTRLRLRTRDFEAAFLSGPLVELLREDDLPAHARLSALGPDVLARRFDAAEAERRLRQRPGREIGEALLDQTALAGIGNVFKSESLFQRGIHPRRRIRDLTHGDLGGLWKETIALMRRSSRVPGSIVTLPPARRKGGETRWVYDRTGRPCFRCGTAVESIRQAGRDTYYCPRCQR
jgi:endonuclease VIII